MINTKNIAILEMGIMMLAVFSFAYMAGDFSGGEKKSLMAEIYLRVITFLFGGNLVSALDFSSIQSLNPQQALQGFQDATGGGYSVCIESKTQATCQKYVNAECPNQCKTGKCVEIVNLQNSAPNEVPDACKIGVCRDVEEGTCQTMSPKGSCEAWGGEWMTDNDPKVAECEVKACCLLADQALFVTEKRCRKLTSDQGLIYGTDSLRDNTITGEPDCISMKVGKVKGACVYSDLSSETPEKNGCKFISQNECKQMGGNFSEAGKLCSSSDLKTNCKAKDHVECVDGRDEVYWFDSCGNQESIFGSNPSSGKENYVIPKNESCTIGDTGDWLKNQLTCGNCNRLSGSVCGNASEIGKKLNGNPKGDAICQDLRCYDSSDNGRRRENGESWCAYQTNFGVEGFNLAGGALSFLNLDVGGSVDYGDGNGGVFKILGGGFSGGGMGIRSIGPPGSLFFRKTCVDGKISIEPCDNYRNSMCVESQTDMSGTDQKFSSASCRLNRGQECLRYNPQQGGGLGQIQMIGAMAKCAADQDCFVKLVNVDKGFRFPVCLPKYPAGYDLSSGGQKGGGDQMCGYASQKCVAVFVKMAKMMGFGGATWECKANCECVDNNNNPKTAGPSVKFVTEMNNFCTSLGDCGAKTNYVGESNLLHPGFETWRCDSADPKNCDRKTPARGLGTLVSSLTGIADISPPKPVGSKVIPAGDPQALLNSAGASSLDLLNAAGSVGGDSSGTGGLYTGGTPHVGGYSGKELPWVAGIAGGTGGALMGAQSAGWLGTTTYTLTYPVGLPVESELTPLGQSMGITETEGFVSEIQYESVTTNSLEEAQAAGGIIPGTSHAGIEGASITSTAAPASGFIGATIGASIGAAAAGGLIAISGIGPGLGSFQTYAIMGTAAAGGALDYLAIYAVGFNPALQFIGTPLLIIAGASIVLSWVQGVGEVRYVHVGYDCKAWQPPMGGANCERCGENGFPCNEYACASLGALCKLEGEEPNIKCIAVSAGDVSAPSISPWDEIKSEGYEYQGLDNGFKVRKTGDTGCISQFNSVTFGILTDKYSRCKYGEEPNMKYEDMAYFGESNSLDKNHSMTIGTEQILAAFNEELKAGEQRDYNIYVKCEDVNGNQNQNDYAINFCVIPDDLMAALVQPGTGSSNWVSYGTENGQISLTANEPVEARWSLLDVPYSEMTHQMNCSSISDGTWLCTATVPLDGNTNTYYMSTLDHPDWAGTDNEQNRHANQQSTVIVIHRSESPLVISSISPDNVTITVGTYAANFDVSAVTSGGVDGSALCEYSLDNEVPVPFIEDATTNHKSPERRNNPGVHTLNVTCRDSAGDIAQNSTSFVIVRDIIAPEITRAYHDTSSLSVVTSENADCKYVNGAIEGTKVPCAFEFEKGMEMGGDGSTIHSVSLDLEKVYYIKCKDPYGNTGGKGGCGIVLKGVLLNGNA